MRILILTYFFPPAYSGEATYVSELASGLLARGHELRVIAAASPGCRESAPPWVRFVDPPAVSRTEQFERFRELFTAALLKAAAEITGGFEWSLVHVQEWFCAEAAAILARRLGVPLIKTIHFVPPPKMTHGSVRWRLADFWQQRSCTEADELIAVGHSLKDTAVSRYRLPGHKISVVHNGVDAASLENRQIPRLTPGRPLVVTVGRLVDQKGIDLLLRSVPLVLEQIPSVRWVVCGGGPAQGAIPAGYLEASARCNGAVQFTGHLPRPAALGWIAAADLFVAPSRFEPFGIAVLEAMLLGKPVIASAVGGPAEMITHNVSGLLIPAHDAGEGRAEVDPSDLARAQVSLLSHRTLAENLGRQGRCEASTRFAWPDFIANTLAVYEKAAAGHAQRNSAAHL